MDRNFKELERRFELKGDDWERVWNRLIEKFV